MMQGNTVRVPPPGSSSSSGASFDLPSSPAAFEGWTRTRARRSSIVSACSITSESSFDRDVDFGIAASITLQVERMLQVTVYLPFVICCFTLDHWRHNFVVKK